MLSLDTMWIYLRITPLRFTKLVRAFLSKLCYHLIQCGYNTIRNHTFVVYKTCSRIVVQAMLSLDTIKNHIFEVTKLVHALLKL